MLEKGLSGGKGYWLFLGILGAVMAGGLFFYLEQLETGLAVTGMSRDVSWGLYISQFTFLVGVAASAVTVVLPYYLHDFKAFGRITILGEFLAVSSVVMCMLFILVDLGQPFRVLHVILYPSPSSPMFWDTVVLAGYLVINLVISWTVLGAERKSSPPPAWVKPLIYLSIPWAVSIHTVTAFLYAGLPGRHLWLSAITAARFLASAFSSGPALLILLGLIVRRTAGYDVGREAMSALGKIVAYAFCAHLFFIGLEIFTAFYSGIGSYSHTLVYLFAGLNGHGALVPAMWASMIAAAVALPLVLVPRWRNDVRTLGAAAALVFVSVWLEKGLGFVVGGFIPSPMGVVTEYRPTMPEAAITLGVWALGFAILTVLYKIFITIRREES